MTGPDWQGDPWSSVAKPPADTSGIEYSATGILFSDGHTTTDATPRCEDVRLLLSRALGLIARPGRENLGTRRKPVRPFVDLFSGSHGQWVPVA